MGSRTLGSVFYTGRYGGCVAYDLSGLLGGDAAANGRAHRNLPERVNGRADLGARERERECHQQPGAALERQCAAVDCFGRGRAAGHAPARRRIRGARWWRRCGTGGKAEGGHRGSVWGARGSDTGATERTDCGAELRRDGDGSDVPCGGTFLRTYRADYFRDEDADGDGPGVLPAPARRGAREEDAVDKYMISEILSGVL